MKYDKIIWFVDFDEETKILETLDKKYNSVFPKTFEEFEKEITPKSFVAFSISKTKNFEKLLSIIRKFPKIKFWEVFRTCTGFPILKECRLAFEKNVKRSFSLREMFLKIKIYCAE